MSSISSSLSAGLQDVANALPSLSSTPSSILQNASSSELSSLTSSSLELQQVSQLFGTSSSSSSLGYTSPHDYVSLSEAALSVLSGLPSGSSSQTALLQQVQNLAGDANPFTPTVPSS